MITTFIVFLLILSVLVLIHELGHFLVAKKLKIKVEEFGFGIPPKAFGIKRGETVYSINWLPIGGFVKLYGEDEAGSGKIKIKDQKSNIKDVNRAFFARPAGQRAAIVVAGVLMNTILAIVIFYTFLAISNFKTELPLISPHKFIFVNQENVSQVLISAVAKNSPAEKEGIRPFSKIISVNNVKIKELTEFINYVNNNKGKEIEITWQDARTNETFKTKITPRISPPKGEGALGVGLFSVQTAILNYETPAQKIFSGITHPVNLMTYNFEIIGKLIGVSLKEKTAAPLGDTVAGPVGIYSLVGSIVKIPDFKERILQVLNLAGLLSISLAVFNILPIPALDGGRLFFIVIEMATRRKVNQKFESYAHAIGMALLLFLIILITFRDLLRLFK